MAAVFSKPLITKLFVFDTKVSAFYFDYHIEDDVYTMEDPRLKLEAAIEDPKETFAALEEHINRFFNSPQPIAVLDYAPNTAVALKQIHEVVKREEAGHLLFAVFIHADDNCRGLGFSKYEDAIWQKYEYINSFMLFPFINKIEVPLDFCVDRDYINRLFMTAHSCPLLPEVPEEEWAACAAKKRRRKGDRAV
ncbi:MAG: hypothetical protein LBO80_00885 [Treponema sp.]|jgi:hypothetical protein|nr:hypothetical protein [Treponema sp.]